jgi:hypothetical protein
MAISFPHPAPFEARLLAKPIPTGVVRAAPANRGVALTSALVSPSPSPAASISRAAAVAAHPGAVALRAMPRRIVDQRDIECCVSCALAGAMEVCQPASPALGRMFHYHVTRFVNLGADEFGRLFLDRGIGTLTAQGICREADHQSLFDAAGAAARPNQAAFDDALTRRILRRQDLRFPYEEVVGTSRAAEIRRHIRDNHPVVLTFTLPMGYPRAFLNDEHEWLDERTPPPSSSRHCVLVVGFDDLRGRAAGAVRIVDSQGTGMFDGGMWWMGYRILDSARVHQAFALT